MQFVAGYVDPGERLVDAVKRYLQEKAGITSFISIEFTGRYYDDPNRHPGTHCIPLIFRVVVPDDTVSRFLDEEMGWFTPEEASKLEFALDNRQILKDLGVIAG